MSNRGNRAARGVQKKLIKIVKDLNARNEIQYMLKNIDGSMPDMSVLSDPNGAVQYEEDILSFKASIDGIIAYLSKMRGKKRHSTVLSEYFNSQMSENFPGIFNTEATEQLEVVDGPASSRKRSRPSTDVVVSETPGAKRSNRRHSDGSPVVRLSNAEKTNIRAIITKLSKLKGSKLFLYPVDKKSYPDYYAMIARPMDFETVKQNLDSYSNVEDALADLRLIWSNCREFNEAGSEISQLADTMENAMEDVVEAKLGAEFVQRRRTSKRTQKVELVLNSPEEPPEENMDWFNELSSFSLEYHNKYTRGNDSFALTNWMNM